MSGLERLRSAGSVAVDAGAYAGAVAGLVVVASTLLGFAAGGDWSTVKAILFVLGAVLLGYATARLWFSTPEWKREHSAEWDAGAQPRTDTRSQSRSRFEFGARAVPSGARTRFQRIVERAPPLRWIDVDRRATLSPTAKIFLAGVMVMGVSFGMETVFGV